MQTPGPRAGRKVAYALLAAVLLWAARAPAAPPPSLKTVPVWRPKMIEKFVKDRAASVRLGKALYWDMQVGSDGVTACGSCHFHAGVDVRTKNQIAPGLAAGDTAFGNNALTGSIDFPHFGPNAVVKAGDFPFHKLADPHDRDSLCLRDTNDVMGAQGPCRSDFLRVRLNSPLELVRVVRDPIDSYRHVNVRRKNARIAPSVINAAYNRAQFFDGRANFFFNGVNPFGPLDDQAAIVVSEGGLLRAQKVRIPNSSLASLCTGPPLDEFEMTAAGRTWPDIGRKLLALRPLAGQLVHPQDSVLGRHSRARLVGGRAVGWTGLRAANYAAMVREAFHEAFWNSAQVVRYAAGRPVVMDRPTRPLGNDEFTQMEANFSLFFGLAVQDYLLSLVSDDSPYDRWQDDPARFPLTAQQQRGLEVFQNVRLCGICHAGSEFTSASLTTMAALAGVSRAELDATTGCDDCACGCEWGLPCMCGPDRPGYLRLLRGTMLVLNMMEGRAISDIGWANTGVRPTAEDVGAGVNVPLINPLTGQPYPCAQARLAILKKQGKLPPQVAWYVPDLPAGADESTPVAVHGAGKIATLRNIDLSGPYFRNGGQATLMQCILFYIRGGDFQGEPHLVSGLMKPGQPSAEDDSALVAFLLTLTDERVRQERAPFDHPQLLVPHGVRTDAEGRVIGRYDRIFRNGFRECEEVFEVPAVGAGGRPAAGLPPLGRFLNLDPYAE